MAALAVAGIAAYVSYWHAYAVGLAHGETGTAARSRAFRRAGVIRLLSGVQA